MERHTHLPHLLKVHSQWVNWLVYHIIDADLRFPSTLLRSHWQVITLIHGVLVLTFLRVQPIALFLVTIFHYFVHLDFVTDTRG